MSDHENTQPKAKRTRRSGQAKKTNNNGEQTPSLTITPPSVDLIEDENIRQLAAELLANMTPTEYTPSGLETKYIDPYIMIQLAINKYVRISSIGNIRLLTPIEDNILPARKEILDAQADRNLAKVLNHYIFLPLTIELPPEITVPVPPENLPKLTQENVLQFIQAYSNIHFQGHTYCANCQHKTILFDEHPWCTMCMLRAKVKCPTDCYICSRMPQEAQDKRANQWTEFKRQLRDKASPRRTTIAQGIENQFVADVMFNEMKHPALKETSTPEERSKQSQVVHDKGTARHHGFTFPAANKPFYYTFNTYMSFLQDHSEDEKRDICASHLAAATRDYKFALCHLNDQRQLPPIGSQQRAYLRPAKSTHSHTTTLGRWPGLRPLAQYIPQVSRYLSPTFLAEALACMLNHSRVVFDLILSPFAKEEKRSANQSKPLVAKLDASEVHAHVNATIYNMTTNLDSVYELDISDKIPSDLLDLPKSTIDPRPQSNHPDKHGFYPTTHSRAFVTHAELQRLDALVRILLKDLETEKFTHQYIEIARDENSHYHTHNETIGITSGVIQSQIHHYEKRNDIIPELAALIILIRRRDNAQKIYDTAEQVRDVMKKELDDSKRTLLQID